MIEWLTIVILAVAILAGLLCIVLGLLGRTPNDLTLGATLLVDVLLIIQLLVAIFAPAFGNEPSGSVLEFYVYLVTAILIPPLAVLWGLLERGSKWSTVVLGAGSLAIAVMVYRMHQIWFVQFA
jgi:RsiW-degrading membrane proteinase PrsW (M82 family)